MKPALEDADLEISAEEQVEIQSKDNRSVTSLSIDYVIMGFFLSGW